MNAQRIDEVLGRDRGQRAGSLRNELLNSIQNEGDPYGLASAFQEMSAEERALGKLKGKLMQCKGYSQVDSAFSWFDAEYIELFPNGLTPLQKNMALLSTISELVGATDVGYRTLRKVLATLNQGE